MHSHAIAATSDPFRALVNGNLVEAAERSAVIRDVQADDFLRFIEYAYRRDYTIPPCTPEVLNEASPDSTKIRGPNTGKVALLPQAKPGTRPGMRFGEESKRSATNSHRLRAEFRNLSYAVDGLPNSELIKQSTPCGNDNADQDFTGILLAHARMYTLAETYMVHPLKTLALHKLHLTLCDFELCDRRTKDIVELCRYAYKNGHDRSEDGTLDRLRALVVEYMAIEICTIQVHEQFLSLIEEGGEFVSDFWVKVARNML